MPTFTTGPTLLPDIGVLSYNGCTFSSLFHSNIASKIVQDAAVRTTKLVELTITAEGVVTLPDTATNIESTLETMMRLLTAQAGVLIYQGRSLKVTVNQPGSPIRDVAWGPVPDVIDITPLGGGRSAMVKWTVKTRIPYVTALTGRAVNTVLQFNEETNVSYGEDGFSTISIKGTLEVPLTRVTQGSRTVPATVDDFRERFMTGIASSIDLTRFRVTRREFPVSRDRRTMEWSFEAEELPYMPPPPDITIARGTYDVRPVKAGVGLCSWLCTLRCTYTVRKDRPRRLAWLAFLALLRMRMAFSVLGNVPAPNGNQNSSNVPLVAAGIAALVPMLTLPVAFVAPSLVNYQANAQIQAINNRKSMLLDFNFSEGLYLDSKTVTFSATWRLVTTFSHILTASGIWKRASGENEWAASIQSVAGWRSWLDNRTLASGDVIVDFGGGS